VATETALGFMRQLERVETMPSVVLIFGPQLFLREYVSDALRRKLVGKECELSRFHIGAGDDFGAALQEIDAPGLFASRKFVFCRVLRSRRERPEEIEDGAADEPSGRGADDAAVADLIERGDISGFLVLLFERDNAPARIRRAAEQSGISVVCTRPYENQISQYVQLFARRLGVKLNSSITERLVEKYGTNLAAIYNTLSKAALYQASESAGFLAKEEGGSGNAPDVFDLAERLTRGQAVSAIGILDRALAIGRDPFEILAVEILPALRRMLTASSMMAKGSSIPEICRNLGLSPTSSLAARALDGARRFGERSLDAAYRAASRLDADFKMGLIKEREQALAEVILELFHPAENRAG
jgi:DNA polymerase III delta subunit